VAVSLGAGGIGITHATTGSGSRAIYTPIEPCRLADLRPPPDQVGPRSAPLGPNETVTLDGWGSAGDCALPAGTAALAINVTALDATAPTFLTVFPAGTTQPLASNLNPWPGAPPTPNLVNVKLSDAGEFSVYNLDGNVNVIIDVVGVFDDHHHDDRYFTKAQVETIAAQATDDAVAALAPWRESLPVSEMFWFEGDHVGFTVVGGGSSGTDGLWLQESGYARFHGGFALPPTYTPGSNFRVDITWAAETTNSSCNFFLEVNSLRVARGGLPTIRPAVEFEEIGDIEESRFSFPDIELAAPPSPGVGKGFLLTNQATWFGVDGGGGDDVPLEPGDHVRFAINRDPEDPLDTCTDDFIITGMSATNG